MLRYIIPSVFFLFIGFSLFGQVPKSVRVIENTSISTSRSQMMCENKSAGTINFLDIDPNDPGNLLTVAQIPEPIFLCHGFQFRVAHNGDQNLEGDTNAATTPGVGYAVYSNRPTNAVTTLAELTADTDRFINPNNPNKPLVFVDDVSGDAVFWNENNFGSGVSLQDSLNNGEPTLFWFAPITFDDEDNKEAVYENGDNSCLHVSTDQAFSVVYLNEITIDNLSKGTCSGSFTIDGGMPEYAASNPSILSDREYTVEIVNASTGAAVTGISGNLEAGGTVNFNVTSAGNYVISVSDGKSCIASSANIGFDMMECPELPSISMPCPYNPNADPDERPIKGSVLCLDLTVEQFTGMASAQFIVKWDTSIMEILSSGNITPNNEIPNLSNAFGYDNLEEGELFFSWLTDNFSDGSTFDDGTPLFNMCFQTKKSGQPNIQLIGYTDPSNFFPLEFFSNDSDIGQVVFDVSSGICPVDIRSLENAEAVIKNVLPPCSNNTNGQFTIGVNYDTLNTDVKPPFNFNLRNSDGDFILSTTLSGKDTTITNLAEDEYTYSIINNETSQSIGNDQIDLNSAVFAPILAPTPPQCFGDSTGTITATVLRGGIPLTTDAQLEGYKFLWSNGDTTRVITNVSIETDLQREFFVTITDPNGCSAEDNTFINQPQELRITTPDITPAKCSGSNDGAITIRNNDIDGGVVPYSYEWDNGSISNSRSGLDVGDYKVTISDGQNCTATRTMNIEGGLELIIDGDEGTVSCFGEEDGILQVSQNQLINSTDFSPLDPNLFEFSWSNGVNQTGISSLVENLSPGTFTVTMSHPNAPPECNATRELEVIEPELLELIVTEINNTTTCITQDGRIEVESQGGTSPYNYSWNFKNDDNNDPSYLQVASPLMADSVTITVTDRNNCISTIDTIVGSPASPIVKKFEDRPLDCADFIDGTLQVIAEPGEGDITGYAWSHNQSVPGNFAGSLTPGTYIVTISDENECITIDSAKVTSPPPIEFTNLDTLQEPCFGEANGSLAVEFTGGATDVGFDLNWLDENRDIVATNNLSVSNVKAGTYSIEGTDANGCEFETSITLPSLPEIEISFPQDRVKGTSCFDNGLNPKDGEAFVEVNYADGRVGEFDVFWPSSQDFGVRESEATNLGSGMIEVLVLESIGICSNSAIVEIPSPSEVMLNDLNTSFDDVTCNGGNDGTITVDAMGGTGPYDYSWDYQGSMATTLRDLPRGTYNVTITDANDCIASDNFEIIEPASMELTLDFTNNNTRNVVCFGDENGQVTVIPSGGNTADGGISYTWTNNVSNSPIATDLAPDIEYSVTATDSKGCTAENFYLVQQPSPILWDIQPDRPIQCNGDVTTLVANELSFSGGNGGDYMYSVDNSPAQTLDKVIQVRAGDHLVSVYDSGGCQQDSTINIPEPEAISIEFPSAELDGRNLVTEVELGGEIALNPDIFSPLPIAELNWTSSNPADSTFLCNDPAFCDNPIVNPLENTTYTLNITDQNGCEAEASLLVEVDKNRNVFIPNAFAPNAKGFDLNEHFKIYSGVGVERIEFARVFDRWGAMVASLDNQLPSPSGIDVWDGKISGQRAPQGVYIYIISISFVDGTTLLYRGDVTVLR